MSLGEAYLQLCDFQSTAACYKRANFLEPGAFDARLAFIYYFQVKFLHYSYFMLSRAAARLHRKKSPSLWRFSGYVPLGRDPRQTYNFLGGLNSLWNPRGSLRRSWSVFVGEGGLNFSPQPVASMTWLDEDIYRTVLINRIFKKSSCSWNT